MNIVLFTSSDETKNENARKELNRIKGLKIEEESATPTLEKKVLTPFIETPEGAQRFGLRSINKYVERELSKAQ